MTTIQEWIAELCGEATPGPKASRVVAVLKTQPHLAAYASAAELASRADVNVATVVRLAQNLGFSGWPELRLELRSRHLATLSANQVLTEHTDAVTDPVVEALQRDLENLSTTARSLDAGTLHAMAEAVVQARRILVIGSGSFAAPGVQLAYIAGTMGLDVSLERHGGTQLASAVTRLRAGDCLVVFNLWWQPHEILIAMEVAQQQGAAVCLVTDRRRSSMAELADHVIVVASEGVSSFPSLTPTMAITHALLAEVARIGGADVERGLKSTEATWNRFGLFDDER